MRVIKLNAGGGTILLRNNYDARELVAQLGNLEVLDENYKTHGSGDYTKIAVPSDLRIEFTDCEFYHGTIEDYRREQDEQPTETRSDLVVQLSQKDDEIISLRAQLDETRLPLAEAAE